MCMVTNWLLLFEFCVFVFVCSCLWLVWMFSIVTQAQEMTFTDKSTAQYILNTDKQCFTQHPPAILPMSSSSSSLARAVYPPLQFSLPIPSYFAPTPLQSCHLLPPNTSSVPPPAPSSTTSPCMHLFPSLTLITSLSLLRSLFQLQAQGWWTHEFNI